MDFPGNFPITFPFAITSNAGLDRAIAFNSVISLLNVATGK